MLDGLESLAAELLAASPAPTADSLARVRELAARIDTALQLHAQDEEKDVFPAVLAAADTPGRRAQAFEFVSSLLVDQFDTVKSWQSLRPALLASSGDLPANLSAPVADFLAVQGVTLSARRRKLPKCWP